MNRLLPALTLLAGLVLTGVPSADAEAAAAANSRPPNILFILADD